MIHSTIHQIAVKRSQCIYCDNGTWPFTVLFLHSWKKGLSLREDAVASWELDLDVVSLLAVSRCVGTPSGGRVLPRLLPRLNGSAAGQRGSRAEPQPWECRPCRWSCLVRRLPCGCRQLWGASRPPPAGLSAESLVAGSRLLFVALSLSGSLSLSLWLSPSLSLSLSLSECGRERLCHGTDAADQTFGLRSKTPAPVNVTLPRTVYTSVAI